MGNCVWNGGPRVAVGKRLALVAASFLFALGVSASQLVITGVSPGWAAVGDPVQVAGTGFHFDPLAHRAIVWSTTNGEGATLLVEGVAPSHLATRVGPDARPMAGTLLVARGVAFPLPDPQVVQQGPRTLWVQDSIWFASEVVVAAPGAFEIVGGGTGGLIAAGSKLDDQAVRVDLSHTIGSGLIPAYRLTVCNFPRDGNGPPPPGDFDLDGGSAIEVGSFSVVYDAAGSETLDAAGLASDLAVAFNQNFAALGLRAVGDGGELVISAPGVGLSAGFASVVVCDGSC